MLTFEQIKKECKPGEHLLVASDGEQRLYLGFNRGGYLVTDNNIGRFSLCWSEENVKYWTIKPYVKPRKTKIITMYQAAYRQKDYVTYSFAVFETKEEALARDKAIGVIEVQVEVLDE